jgi:hypothetical protein
VSTIQQDVHSREPEHVFGRAGSGERDKSSDLKRAGEKFTPAHIRVVDPGGFCEVSVQHLDDEMDYCARSKERFIMRPEPGSETIKHRGEVLRSQILTKSNHMCEVFDGVSAKIVKG